jgi:hypothetical protein
MPRHTQHAQADTDRNSIPRQTQHAQADTDRNSIPRQTQHAQADTDKHSMPRQTLAVTFICTVEKHSRSMADRYRHSMPRHKQTNKVRRQNPPKSLDAGTYRHIQAQR